MNLRINLTLFQSLQKKHVDEKSEKKVVFKKTIFPCSFVLLPKNTINVFGFTFISKRYLPNCSDELLSVTLISELQNDHDNGKFLFCFCLSDFFLLPLTYPMLAGCLVCYPRPDNMCGPRLFSVFSWGLTSQPVIMSAMVCTVCSEDITDRAMKAGERLYHEHHFTCSVCQMSLTDPGKQHLSLVNKSFDTLYFQELLHTRSMISSTAKMITWGSLSPFAPNVISTSLRYQMLSGCHSANNPKLCQECVKAMDKNWHPECFQCVGCSVQFSGSLTYRESGEMRWQMIDDWSKMRKRQLSPHYCRGRSFLWWVLCPEDSAKVFWMSPADNWQGSQGSGRPVACQVFCLRGNCLIWSVSQPLEAVIEDRYCIYLPSKYVQCTDASNDPPASFCPSHYYI